LKFPLKKKNLAYHVKNLENAIGKCQTLNQTFSFFCIFSSDFRVSGNVKMCSFKMRFYTSEKKLSFVVAMCRESGSWQGLFHTLKLKNACWILTMLGVLNLHVKNNKMNLVLSLSKQWLWFPFRKEFEECEIVGFGNMI